MSHQFITLRLDARLLRHPRALHLKQMRIGLWLYLELLCRLESGDSLEFLPEVTAREMGLKAATVRSWLGHLRKAGYVGIQKAGEKLLITIRNTEAAEASKPAVPTRFFTVSGLQAALGEEGDVESLETVLSIASDRVIQRALAGALAVPGEQIRKSRTALFLYFIKRYNHETNQDQDDSLH